MENCLAIGPVLPVGIGIGTLPGTGVPSQEQRKWICKDSAPKLLCLPPLLAQPDPRKSLAFATGCCAFWRNASMFPPISGPPPFMICASLGALRDVHVMMEWVEKLAVVQTQGNAGEPSASFKAGAIANPPSQSNQELT